MILIKYFHYTNQYTILLKITSFLMLKYKSAPNHYFPLDLYKMLKLITYSSTLTNLQHATLNQDKKAV